MSTFGFDRTPPKKSNTDIDSEESSPDWSPKTDFCESPNSIAINWDFPKPRLSRKIKQDVKALAATMKSAHIKKRRLRHTAFRNSIGSKTQGVEKQTSPLSHMRQGSPINKKIIPMSRFDYEELEKIDIGGYVNISLPHSHTVNNNNTNRVIASSSTEPFMTTNDEPKNLTATLLKEADTKNDKSVIDNNAIVSKELPKHVIDQFLNEDIINLFLTSELDSW